MKNHLRNNLSQREWDPEVLSKKNPLFKSKYDDLLWKHDKHELSVAETLLEIKMSSSDFYNKKKKGVGIPCYRQKKEKARISFPIVCVALFLSKDLNLVN